MWFKNMQLFRLPVPWSLDLARLDEQLARGGRRPEKERSNGA